MKKILTIFSFALFVNIQAAIASPDLVKATIEGFLPKTATVKEVIVQGNYAVATWEDGHSGSTATLRRNKAGWDVLSLSMRGWPPVEIYAEQHGMTIDEAVSLYDALDPNWRKWQ